MLLELNQKDLNLMTFDKITLRGNMIVETHRILEAILTTHGESFGTEIGPLIAENFKKQGYDFYEGEVE